MKEFNLDTLKNLIETCKAIQQTEPNWHDRTGKIHSEIESCFFNFILALESEDEEAIDPVFTDIGVIEALQCFYKLLDFSNFNQLEYSFEPELLNIIDFYTVK